MFMELYYKNYHELCRGAYWKDPVSLPFSVMIYSKEERKLFENMLREDGFGCVVWENECPCMYVNFTLKRYGRNTKACGSATINDQPLTKAEFMEKVYLPWRQDPETKKKLEENFVLSAQISLWRTEKDLEENICAGRANENYIRWKENSIARYRQYLKENTTAN